jgi:hypothetical protein
VTIVSPASSAASRATVARMAADQASAHATQRPCRTAPSCAVGDVVIGAARPSSDRPTAGARYNRSSARSLPVCARRRRARSETQAASINDGERVPLRTRSTTFGSDARSFASH